MAQIKGRSVLYSASFLAFAFTASAADASVTISTTPTSNMNCSAGVCSPTAKKAVLNVNDLTAMLANEDVKIVTGNGAVTISVFAPFSWTSSHRLTLDAYYNVTFQTPVTVAGKGGVTIVTNDGGTGGDLIFFPTGKLDFLDTSSKLKINRTSYMLVNGIGTIAANVNHHPVAIAMDEDLKQVHFRDVAPIQHLRGVLEGLGHTIANLTLKSGSKVCFGLIGNLKGTVRDLVLTNADVQAGDHVIAAGTLVGCNYGLLANASADGIVKTNSIDVGGLVGRNYSIGMIVRSHANVRLSSGAGDNSNPVRVGGLVGDSFGTILRSYAQGRVDAEGSDLGGVVTVGGLVGRCASCDQTFASGAVTAHTVSAGGIVVGGLVGEADNVTNSYATGAATGGDVDGGLAGTGCCVISSYSRGEAAGFTVGGFVGRQDDSPAMQSDYWDEDTSGMTQGCGDGDCTGVTGLTDAQLKAGLPAGFDPAIWGQRKNINNGYPYLLANPPPQ